MSDTITPDFTAKIGYAFFTLYDKFSIFLPISDWVFMCERRWFSDEPERADVEAEFGVCGARSAKSNEEANEIVQNTVYSYKRMMNTDEN